LREKKDLKERTTCGKVWDRRTNGHLKREVSSGGSRGTTLTKRQREKSSKV